MNAFGSLPQFRHWLIALFVVLGVLTIALAFHNDAIWGLRTDSAEASPAGCVPGDTSTMVWPTLTQVSPDNTEPGQAVVISGHGGYIYCDDGSYNESARSFALTLDDAAFGQIVCYVNYCQTTITIPVDTLPGSHIIATEGGSQIAIQIQQARIQESMLFFPCLFEDTE